MSDAEDTAVAAVVIIIVVVVSQQDHHHRPQRFWVRLSLDRGRKKYNMKDFMKNLLLDEVDELNLENRCDMGSNNFFRMNNSDFENY